MGAVHVHEFISLDGVIDTPSWTFEYGFDERMGEAIGAVTERCAGILLGRTTYAMFEQGWADRTVEDDPGAPFFNDTTKYVVSSTLTEPGWQHTTVLDGDPVERVRGLKEQPGADIVVTGSITLCHALIGAGLVDEYRLFTYPVVQGRGRRLFPDGAAEGRLRLVECRGFRGGVTYSRYAQG